MALSPSAKATHRAELEELADAYLAQARALTYERLCANQEAPWAGIGHGAGGIVTALQRSRRGRGGARDAASARRWLDDAIGGSRAHRAFWTPSFGRSMATSLYYGPDGLHLLRLLGARGGGRGRRVPDDAMLRSFLARCRGRRGGPAELVEGVAGTLTALVLLYRATRDARVLSAADDLARDLLARAGGREGWGGAPNLYFAHGRAGTLHALLGWSLATGRTLPAEFSDHLARFAGDAEGAERAATRDAKDAGELALARVYHRSWCNGIAGFVLLWARACEHTPDRAYLAAARAAARRLLTHQGGAPGNLCCGLGGRAFALLAMDRVDPGRGWADRALVLGARAASALLDGAGQWPNGLLTGYPGVVCLARDLASDAAERVGFPLVEGA